MEKFLKLIVVLSFTGFSFAQDVKIVHVDNLNTDISGTEVEVVGDASDSRIYYDVRVINLTGSSMEMRYQRKRIANSGRTDEICDNNLCYTATDDMWYQTPAPATIAHEDSSILKPQIAPQGQESCGIHVYYVVSGSTVHDSLTIKFRTSNSNCFLNLDKENISTKELKLYPNPAENIVNIENLVASDESVIIFDALGKEVLSRIVDSSVISLELSALRNGIYFVRIKRENGSLSEPKKLIIRK